MNDIFETRPLSVSDGLLIVGLAIALFLVLEGEKLLMRRLGWFGELKP